MAHPMKKEIEGVSGHSAKLRRMTRGYGMANPSEYKDAPDAKLKHEGPEEDVGYGADSSAAKARGDRPGRKTKAANPVSTYKRGGAVKRARGGRTKSKGTHVNVIVAPQSAPAAPGPMAGPPLGGNPAVPPVVPPVAGPMAGPGPMPPPGPMAGGMKPPMPMPPGTIPPGVMPPRKRGGRVTHSDEREDKALVRKMVKPGSLKARGGRMTAGADSGPGRLEKSEIRARHARKEHAQRV